MKLPSGHSRFLLSLPLPAMGLLAGWLISLSASAQTALVDLHSPYGTAAAMSRDMARVSPLADSWRREMERPLERMGFIDRNSPYRVSLPLVTFGNSGQKFAFTYVPHTKDGSASRVFMIFFKANLD